MDTTKTFDSKTGYLLWIDDHHPEYEDAEPVRLPSVLNRDGWVVSQVWAVRLPSGAYVTGQEEGRT